jgi:glycosyltransferase 2 family protein
MDPADVRRLSFIILRLLVTIGLLWFLASQFDFRHATEIASHVSLLLLIAALAALVASVLVNAVRWQVILAGEGPAPGLGSLTKLLLVGLFFNQVLPTGVGGDAVRAWRCHRLGVPLGAAVRSVLIDRASGYVVMVVIYIASLPILLRVMPDPGARAGILMVLAVALAGLLALPLVDFLPTQLMRLPGIAAIADLSRATRRLVLDPGRCTATFGLSILMIGLAALTSKLVSDSLGVPLSFATWLVIIPPITLIQLAPVSLAGWGVREAAMVIFLASFGVPAAAALAISVLMGLALIVLGLPGGLIWFANWDVAAARLACNKLPLPPVKPDALLQASIVAKFRSSNRGYPGPSRCPGYGSGGKK